MLAAQPLHRPSPVISVDFRRGRGPSGRLGAYRETGFMPKRGAGLIARLADLTGASDGEIAHILDMGRSTVQAYRTERLQENLSDAQVKMIVDAAHRYLEEVQRGVAEIELLS